MKIVFVSNYYSHHQAPFSMALYEKTNHNYFFIETQELEEERKNMGWSQESIPLYVKKSYISRKHKKECQKLINEADIVIWGSCPFYMIYLRLIRKKITFAYSERLFKKGFNGLKFWGRALKYFFKLKFFQKNHYLLCAGGYVATDYNKIGLFYNQMYKFGYFPENIQYDLKELLIKKNKSETIELLWAGRMIEWKHPEKVIWLANVLKKKGYKIHITMIGNGSMRSQLLEMIKENDLIDVITILDFMSPKKVREYMEKANVYLFTSDFGEGWGAVLNEAMNSGCAVVVSDAVGAAPFLIKDGENGFIYHYGDDDEILNIIERLLNNQSLFEKIGINAYLTIDKEWNANIAASNFINLCFNLMRNEEKNKDNYLKGPCSIVK